MSDASEHARETREIMSRIIPRFQNAEAACTWFSTEPLPGFSGATALQLVSEGRASAVIEYINAVDVGVYA